MDRLRRVWIVFFCGVATSGIILLSVRFREFIFPPPPNYSIALLGALAVVIVIVLPKEPSIRQQSLADPAAFLIMFLEMWAVRSDREKQNSNFASIVGGLRDSIDLS